MEDPQRHPRLRDLAPPDAVRDSIEAGMRDIIRRGILSATANDVDDGIDVAAMEADAV